MVYVLVLVVEGLPLSPPVQLLPLILPDLQTGGLDVGGGNGLSTTGKLAIATSVGMGGFVVLLVANFVICSLVITRCRKSKSYTLKHTNTSGEFST